MRNGIVSGVLPTDVPFSHEIMHAAEAGDFSAFVISAIQSNETNGMADAATVISGDGGHGVMQLTESYPANWAQPYANILYAISYYLLPAEKYWSTIVQGEDLVRCIAAEYNAGRANAMAGHESGNVDLFTTNDYGARALATYKSLLAGAA